MSVNKSDRSKEMAYSRVIRLMLFSFIIPVIFLNAGCGGGGGAPAALTPTPTPTPVASKVHGFNFSPYIDGQSPNLGAQVSEAQLRTRMEIVRPYTEWVRTFGCSNGLEKSGSVAHSLGLKIAMGAWISSDETGNEVQLANLIAAAKAGEADILLVGSETLLNGYVSEETLIGYIERVKEAVPDLPVGYVETHGVLLAHPNVIDAVDVVVFNCYPFWEQENIENAMTALREHYALVKAAAGGKRVIVGETGWPSAGEAYGNAVASLANATRYFREVAGWARENDIELFYFEAFDESWKASR